MEIAGKGMNHFPALGGLPQLHTEGQSGSRWTSHFVHMETSSPVPTSKAVWQFHCPGGAGLVSVAFATWQIGVQVNPMWVGGAHSSCRAVLSRGLGFRVSGILAADASFGASRAS